MAATPGRIASGEKFADCYDQNSFDPDFESMPLEAFEPMLRRVTETPKQSIYKRA